MIPSNLRAVLASAVVYAAATAAMGRHLLASPSSVIAADVGDPMLNAAILAWNARRLPWTDGWFNFPAFYPAADVLTFSEHLLGVSVIATPLNWVTGDAVAAYNLTLLSGYVLCGLAMFALVKRLTGSAAAAFVAGAAYAFAPYRAAQLSHIQVGIAFWAPLALLGLHAYLQSGRRRWLALFGAGWMLQGAANLYFLVYFSVLVGLWILWFVVTPRRWRDLRAIAIALAIAVVPLLPILAHFAYAHAHYGLSRPPEEIAGFGADIGALLCASEHLAVWHSIQLACRPEGQLFPGVTLVLLCAVGVIAARTARTGASPDGSPGRRRSLLIVSGIVSAVLVVAASPVWEWSSAGLSVSSSSVIKPLSRGLLLLALASLWWIGVPRAMGRLSPGLVPGPMTRRVVGLVLLAAGIVFLAAAGSVVIAGPWRWSLPQTSLSAVVSTGALTTLLIAVAMALKTGAGTSLKTSVPRFYVIGAIATWFLSWGPVPVLAGTPFIASGPYAWLLLVPGLHGLRAPARFWMMTVLCLSILAGFAIVALLERRSWLVSRAVVAVIGVGLIIDGWATVPAAALLPRPPDPASLRGGVVLTLPLGSNRDIDINAQFVAVTDGWSSVNGFSGYEPFHYDRLRRASSAEEPWVFEAFRRHGDLHVVVAPNAGGRLTNVVEQQPGATLVAASNGWRQYRIPQRGRPSASVGAGPALAVSAVSASCSSEMLPFVTDGDYTTRWHCGPQAPGQTLGIDLGHPVDVRAVVLALGEFRSDQPRALVVEWSHDGREWQEAWNGDVRIEMLEAEITEPLRNRLIVPIGVSAARYLRARQVAQDDVFYWSVAELEVW